MDSWVLLHTGESGVARDLLLWAFFWVPALAMLIGIPLIRRGWGPSRDERSVEFGGESDRKEK